jgi:hypothetical protein
VTRSVIGRESFQLYENTLVSVFLMERACGRTHYSKSDRSKKVPLIPLMVQKPVATSNQGTANSKQRQRDLGTIFLQHAC